MRYRGHLRISETRKGGLGKLRKNHLQDVSFALLSSGWRLVVAQYLVPFGSKVFPRPKGRRYVGGRERERDHTHTHTHTQRVGERKRFLFFHKITRVDSPHFCYSFSNLNEVTGL